MCLLGTCCFEELSVLLGTVSPCLYELYPEFGRFGITNQAHPNCENDRLRRGITTFTIKHKILENGWFQIHPEENEVFQFKKAIMSLVLGNKDYCYRLSSHRKQIHLALRDLQVKTGISRKAAKPSVFLSRMLSRPSKPAKPLFSESGSQSYTNNPCS